MTPSREDRPKPRPDLRAVSTEVPAEAADALPVPVGPAARLDRAAEKADVLSMHPEGETAGPAAGPRSSVVSPVAPSSAAASPAASAVARNPAAKPAAGKAPAKAQAKSSPASASSPSTAHGPHAPARSPAQAPAPSPAPSHAPGHAPASVPGQAKAPAAAPVVAAAPARLRPRHWGVLASFLLLVLLPFIATTTYLYTRAADEYHSEVAFSVRSEQMAVGASGILGALTQFGGGGGSDANILYQYIRSQQIVEAIAARLDLRAIWNRPGTGWADGDPFFTLGDNPTIEALHDQWNRMVSVSYDQSSGILDVMVRAFTPEDARAVAQAILTQSTELVNTLSTQSREDAVRFARETQAEAEAGLRHVRGELADFRHSHGLVDPKADVAGESGILNALNQELARALVERDVLLSYAPETDQRVQQANRKIDAITKRIEEERSTLGVTGVEGSLPDVVGRYEELLVDLEFAQKAYTETLAGLAAARAEARRQSRYLAAHVSPTLASTALYPRRASLAGLTLLFLVLGWGTAMVIYYNIRDNS